MCIGWMDECAHAHGKVARASMVCVHAQNGQVGLQGWQASECCEVGKVRVGVHAGCRWTAADGRGGWKG